MKFEDKNEKKTNIPVSHVQKRTATIDLFESLHQGNTIARQVQKNFPQRLVTSDCVVGFVVGMVSKLKCAYLGKC